MAAVEGLRVLANHAVISYFGCGCAGDLLSCDMAAIKCNFANVFQLFLWCHGPWFELTLGTFCSFTAHFGYYGIIFLNYCKLLFFRVFKFSRFLKYGHIRVDEYSRISATVNFAHIECRRFQKIKLVIIDYLPLNACMSGE